MTSHVTTDPYPDLLSEKGGTGFPYLVILDAEGNPLSKVTGARTIEGFEQAAGKAKEFVKFRALAERGDARAQCQILLARLEMGLLNAAEARREAAELKDVPSDLKTRLDGFLADFEVDDVLREVRLEAGRRFLQMKKSGRVPQDGDKGDTFWSHVLEFAEDRSDGDVFEEALEAIKKIYGDQINQKWVERQEQILKKIREP
ncbi:MAG: hypothetical protein HYY16_15975 [Planctomycetes bacterium]|nr:hypothetical protein [Planctomycetota bacterium]